MDAENDKLASDRIIKQEIKDYNTIADALKTQAENSTNPAGQLKKTISENITGILNYNKEKASYQFKVIDKIFPKESKSQHLILYAAEWTVDYYTAEGELINWKPKEIIDLSEII